jgi:ribosome maturation factor RimP
MSDAADRVRQILDPIIESVGVSLWDLEFHKQGPRWLLRIYIDRDEGGVTLNDCETISRDLSAVLDVEEVIPHSYTLEVSSPGLDRALLRPEHFERFTGSLVRVKTFQLVNGQKVFRGRLLGLEDGVVKLELQEGPVIEVPLADITKASLEVD